MKLSLTKEQLINPLGRVIGAVDRKGALPVLECVLLETGKEGLRMTATNLEIQLIAHDDIEKLPAISVLIHARKLFDILRTLPDKARVDISLGESRATVSSGRSRFSLGTLPAETFPAFDGGGIDHRVAVEPSRLRQALQKVQTCIAAKDVRYYLCGALFRITDESLDCVGSDGHRLAQQSLPLASKNDHPAEIIVPRMSVIELMKMLPDESQPEPCEIAFSSRTIWLDLPGITFASKLIEGRYPDFNRVLPRDFDAEITVDRGTIMAAIRRSDIMSNEHHAIQFDLADKTISFASSNTNGEECGDEIDVDFDGKAGCGFNASYLLDALGTIDTDQCEIRFNSEKGTIFESSPSDAGFYIVMPMRL